MKCCFSRRTICFLLSFMLLVCIVPMAANASTNYLTMDQAVVEIRNQLKERNPEFSVYIKADKELTENDCIDMFYRAMEHTGKPTEGDYLQYHLKEMGATFSVELKDGKYNNCINYTLKYLASAQQEKKLDTVFRSTVDGLRLSEISDYHKVKFIYDYIISNITYDYAHKEDESYNLKASAYAALLDKTCVCQGYANLFYRMCLDAGVDCRILSGIGNGEDHAWNIVCLDGKYYNVDCTWDAELYQSGQESQYFLKSEANFGDHARAEEYKTEAFLKKYPMAAKDYKVKGPDPVVGDEKDWTYIVDSEKAIISSYVGNDEDVVVPSMLGGYPVIQVGWMGQTPFFRNNKVRSITFSEGIVNLGSEWAFECENLEEIHYSSTVYGFSNLQTGIAGVPMRCPNLKTVTVSPNNPYYTVYKNDLYSRDMTWLFYHPSGDPRTVLKIPDGVIGISNSACEYAQNLKEVVMPDTVTHIGFWAFSDAINLKKVNISNACKSIMQFAFYRTALRTVHLPASLEEMHFDVFRECMSLESITVSEDNPRFRIHDGCLYEDESPLSYPPARSAKKHTVAPGARAILWGAFADAKNLEEVIIPDTVIDIGGYAFDNCMKLTTIHIPGSVTHIGSQAFHNCRKLTNFYITDLEAWLKMSIEDVEADPMNAGSTFSKLYLNGELLTDLKIPEGITQIRDYAFSRCNSLTSISIPEGVTSIGKVAFSNCRNLTSIDLPDSLTSIGGVAFADCIGLTKIVIPDSVTSLGMAVVSGCSNLTDVVLPDGVTILESSLFSGCHSLKEIKIPEGVIIIGHSAFQDCRSLKKIELPNSVKSIEPYAFSGCSNLAEIIIPAKVKNISDMAFSGVGYECGLYGQGEKITHTHVYYGGSKKAFDAFGIVNLYDISVHYKCTKPDWKSSTCDEERICKTCGKTFEPKGHDWGEWKLIKKPTTSKEGMEKRECERKGCDHTETRNIGKKPAKPSAKASNVESSGKIKIKWDKVEGAKEYQVYRATSKDGSYKKLTTTTKTSYTDKTAKVGKKYYYKVRAISETGVKSSYSSIVSKLCKLAQPEVKVTNTASSGKVKLTWEKVEGASKYYVYRATSKDGKYTKVKSTTSTSFTDSDAKVGKKYYYKVKAIYSKDTSANSDYSDIENGTRDLARPDVKVKLSKGDPKLTWEKISGAKEYKIYRATSKDGKYKAIKTTTSLKYTDKSAKAGKTYYYKVKAIHKSSSANSAYSSVDKLKAK